MLASWTLGYAVNGLNVSEAWARYVAASMTASPEYQFGASACAIGGCSLPNISGSGQIAYVGGISEARVTAFNMVTGATVWASTISGTYATPVAALEGGKVAVSLFPTAGGATTAIVGPGGAVMSMDTPVFANFQSSVFASPVAIVGDTMIGRIWDSSSYRVAGVITSVDLGFDFDAGHPLERGSPEQTGGKAIPVLLHFMPDDPDPGYTASDYQAFMQNETPNNLQAYPLFYTHAQATVARYLNAVKNSRNSVVAFLGAC